MKYRIIGTTIPAVEIKFDAPGETMYTQSGGMSWMSEGISMSDFNAVIHQLDLC